MDLAVSKLLQQRIESLLNQPIGDNAKALFKIQSAAEKLKQDFTARGANDLECSISCVVDQEDYDDMFSKEDFDVACDNADNIYGRFYHFVFDAVQAICPDTPIDIIEAVGSTMRIPRLSSELLKAVQHHGSSIEKVSTSLNMEESCARGCALFAQMYFEEKKLGCSVMQVPLVVDEEKVCEMSLFCCDKAEEGKSSFTISAQDELLAGNEHDCINKLMR